MICILHPQHGIAVNTLEFQDLVLKNKLLRQEIMLSDHAGSKSVIRVPLFDILDS